MKNIFKKSNYEKYYKDFIPYIKKDKNKQYISIILTLGVSIFFLIFAINPTITTIVKLKKDLKDSEFVEQALEKKIANMSSLFQQREKIKSDIPLILEAVPQNPEATILFAQMQSIADSSSVNLTNESTTDVPLDYSNASDSASFNFQVTASGPYENVYEFLSNLTNMQRAVSIESININNSTQGDGIDAAIIGTTFYKK